MFKIMWLPRGVLGYHQKYLRMLSQAMSRSVLLFSLCAVLAAAAVRPAAAQSSAAAASTAPARDATFKGVAGDVRVVPGDGRVEGQRQAQPGAPLSASERIVTGPDGSAAFVARDGTVVSVGPNTSVALSRFEFDSTTQRGRFALDLLRGTVRVVTGLRASAGPDRFSVTTPTSTIGVRGTDFIVEVF
jgi:hypothetical protein